MEFLANMERIRTELVQGWPIRAIYDRLSEEGSIHFGYDQMVRYIHKFIRGEPAEKMDKEDLQPGPVPESLEVKPKKSKGLSKGLIGTPDDIKTEDLYGKQPKPKA